MKKEMNEYPLWVRVTIWISWLVGATVILSVLVTVALVGLGFWLSLQ
jgi:hypothetical protein